MEVGRRPRDVYFRSVNLIDIDPTNIRWGQIFFAYIRMKFYRHQSLDLHLTLYIMSSNYASLLTIVNLFNVLLNQLCIQIKLTIKSKY